MELGKLRSVAITIISIILIGSVSLALIAFGRGYRFDIKKKILAPTGLLTVTSDPTGAQVLVDGKKLSATNTTVNLVPGWYTITMVKEGYQSWEKKIRVQGEVVARADATLFPVNPSLRAITSSGVTAPVLSPDGTKLAFIVPFQASQFDPTELPSRSGIWVLDLVDKPLSVNRDARQILKYETLNITEATTLSWSPDSKQVLVNYYLLNSDSLNDLPKLVPDMTVLQTEWQTLKNSQDKEKLLTLPDEFVSVATQSAKIISFSPDETKIFYEATSAAALASVIKPALIGTNPTEEEREITPDNLYVYDVKEDRNYLLGKIKDFSLIQWLPSSRHLIITGKDRIDVMEYDGTNRKTVYAGPFWDGFVAPWTNGSRLLILTNLNSGASAVNNLYAVNIR